MPGEVHKQVFHFSCVPINEVPLYAKQRVSALCVWVLTRFQKTVLSACDVNTPIHTEPRSNGVGGGEGRLKGLERRVLFGDTPQGVAGSLGAPSKVFFKAEDKVLQCYYSPPLDTCC